MGPAKLFSNVHKCVTYYVVKENYNMGPARLFSNNHKCATYSVVKENYDKRWLQS